MNTIIKGMPDKSRTTALKVAATLLLANGLSGCIVAIPPALQAASFALDGLSYVTTGKSVTDHAISAVADRDCAMFRALNGEAICSKDVQLAELDALERRLDSPNAVVIAKTIVPARDDAVFQRASANMAASGNVDADEVLDDESFDLPNMKVAQGPAL